MTTEQTLAEALIALIDAIQDSDFALDFADDIDDATAALVATGHYAEMATDEPRAYGPRA